MADAAAVLRWLSITNAEQVAAIGDDLQDVLDAVTSTVQASFALPDTPTAGQQAAWDRAIVMQTGRIWRRKGTPEGVFTFGSDGVIRIAGIDADVERMLGPFRQFNFS